MLAVTAPGRLRLSRRELPYIVSFGVAGFAFVQWFYFLAINRLAIGVALLIEYLAPLLVALWARFFYKETVRRCIWVALGLALTGLALIVNVFGSVRRCRRPVSCSRGSVEFGGAAVVLAAIGLARRPVER
jgi:drug/metabolite transporter (DMT)-like permease